MVSTYRSSALRRLARAVLAAGMGTVALTAFASAQAQAPPALAAKPPALDPESIAALKRMGRYLVSLRSFEIAATVFQEMNAAVGRR